MGPRFVGATVPRRGPPVKGGCAGARTASVGPQAHFCRKPDAPPLDLPAWLAERKRTRRPRNINFLKNIRVCAEKSIHSEISW
jgi:hypothetical protein